MNATEAAKECCRLRGELQFQPIEGTTIKYATNTPNKVIEVAPQYYLCYQGVWFVSPSPSGAVGDGADRTGYLYNPARPLA